MTTKNLEMLLRKTITYVQKYLFWYLVEVLLLNNMRWKKFHNTEVKVSSFRNIVSPKTL